ncbi:hypothetical protein [Natronorubrum texcoconense]|uniref:Uncharacterized protein n=1 Tax=Natronorubrum texcoconense TaxID=1095776 RepID=A0A1G9HAK3_9EURY|nr:hypothetical protein [Natronorubrum texcoconense]SDL10038.1 hypothetical protein SAMN04515672_0177 [Natronorubrum texcoconense]
MTRHRTDEQRETVVAGCPNGCQSFELESEGTEDATDKLVETVTEAYDECRECGASMGVLRDAEPVEELE